LNEKRKRTGFLLVAEEVVLVGRSRVKGDNPSWLSGGGFLYSLMGV
jgi:hypothetical protein